MCRHDRRCPGHASPQARARHNAMRRENRAIRKQILDFAAQADDAPADLNERPVNELKAWAQAHDAPEAVLAPPNRQLEEGTTDEHATRTTREADGDGLRSPDTLGPGQGRVPTPIRPRTGNPGSRSSPDSRGLAGRKDPLHDGIRPVLTVGGQPATVLKQVPDTSRTAQLRERGLKTPTVYELTPDSAPGYASAMQALKTNNRYHASVEVYPEDDYRQMRLFTVDDGTAGFALKDDELVSVFCHQDSIHRGSTPALLVAAVHEGARRLDCFDTALPGLYARGGFVPVARLGWNDEYAPDGWDKGTYRAFNDGRPDVVFMAYDPSALDSRYVPGGERVEDYDAGSELAAEYAQAHGVSSDPAQKPKSPGPGTNE